MAIAFTDQPTSGPFHRTTLWHRTAPRELFKAWFSGDDEHRWAVWKKHLARRKKPEPLEFLIGKRPPIFWGWPAAWRRDEIAGAVSPLARSNAVHAASRANHVDLPQALEAVAAAHALPDLAKELSAGAWWSLAETLHRLAGEAQHLRVDAAHDPENIVRQQLFAGELPLALSYLFPELQPMRSAPPPSPASALRRDHCGDRRRGLATCQVAAGARSSLGLLDPLPDDWRSVSPRCLVARDAENQYLWLVRRMIRLIDAGGFLPLDQGESDDEPSLKPILAAALEMVGDTGDAAAAAAAISKSIVPRSLKIVPKKQPDASLESAWSCLAVLAGGWSSSTPRLTVAFADEPLQFELCAGGRKIFAGNWTMTTVCDGQRISPIGAWQELCWQSEKKCDFLELGVELAEGVQLERQIVLSKRDNVLLVADVVSAKDHAPHKLRHSFSLPLGRRVVWLPETETRDGVLVANKQQTAVLPIGLFEWRSDPRGGTLTSESGRLTLAEASTGRSLYTGLIIDLDPARSKKCRTWRQLTVSEMLQVVPRDLAVGFRAQSGDDQWLVYRSLGPAGNRSVIGQNISSEFYAGRFKEEDGLVAEWIEIEAEPS